MSPKVRHPGWRVFVQGIFALLLAGVGFVVTATLHSHYKISSATWGVSFQHPFKDGQGLPLTVASKVVRDELDAETSIILPFYDAGSKKQFIVAVEKPERVGKPNEVYILSQQDGGYHTKHLRSPACAYDAKKLPLSEAVGLVDLRGDGSHQVFTVCVSLEEGTPVTKLLLMDTPNEITYSATEQTGFFPKYDQLQIDVPNEDPRFTAWFRSEALKFDPWVKFNATGLAHEVDQWRSLNPSPINGQPLKFTLVPGNIPGLDPQEDASIDSFENLEIHDFNDGPIIIYDKTQHNHYVFYVPARPSVSIFENLMSNAQYLFLSINDDAENDKEKDTPDSPHLYEQIRYDRQAQTMMHAMVSLQFGVKRKPSETSRAQP